MPRPPNYSMERKDRERAKAQKKADKLAAKAAARERGGNAQADDAEAQAPQDDERQE
ncbi:MAG: hypothetical protein KF810_06210 [Rhizobiaceae bacterium]|nr:hypothetical protein [Rhizobiaceae bacterium]